MIPSHSHIYVYISCSSIQFNLFIVPFYRWRSWCLRNPEHAKPLFVPCHSQIRLQSSQLSHQVRLSVSKLGAHSLFWLCSHVLLLFVVGVWERNIGPNLCTVRVTVRQERVPAVNTSGQPAQLRTTRKTPNNTQGSSKTDLLTQRTNRGKCYTGC